MTSPDCAEMELLLQADHDGELDIQGAARLAAHLQGCAHCRAVQSELEQLSRRLRSEVPRFSAPAALRAAIAAAAPAPVALPWHRRVRSRAWPALAAAAIAASVTFAVLPQGPDLADSVVASHIRALQPGHLMDVVSTDQHTVKPWFDGRLDFAPPVKDLAASGFPLTGGRLDYLGGRAVAALSYGSARHVINLAIWPGQTTEAHGSRNGYSFVRFSDRGMILWAVSDLNANELQRFVENWKEER